MFSRLKLSTKIFGGFACVLILLCIVAFAGNRGVSTIESRMEKLQGFQSVVEEVMAARQQEKNYIIRKDEDSISKNKEALAGLIEHTKSTRELFDDKVNIDQANDILAKADAYQAAFGSYIDLENQKVDTLTEMRTKARVALEKTEAILENQNAQLETGIVENREFVADKQSKSAAAVQMLGLAKDARAARIVLMYDDSDENMAAWKKINDELLKVNSDLRARFNLQVNIDQANIVEESYTAYIKDFKEYLATQDQKTLDAALKSAVITMDEIEAIRDDQQKQLADALEQQEKFVVLKVEMASDAAHMIEVFKDTRKNEKEYFISQDKKFYDLVMDNLKKLYASAQELKADMKMQEDIDRMDATTAALKEYDTEFNAYVELMNKQNAQEAEMLAAARATIKVCEEGLADQKQKMQEEVTKANSILLTVSLIAVIAGIVLAWLITRGIVKPLNKVIAGMTEGSEQVASASTQVAQSSQEMAEGASEQASSLEEVSASLEEMTSMTKQNADNAMQANSSSSEAAQAATQGRQAMERMSDAIGKIKASSDETAKIIKTIDEIAFQTNLLALNAAVEAARAGDAGKGFAVVAEEVRNLAQRSAEAAKSTAALIDEAQQNADNGVNVSTEVAEILNKIAEGVQNVTSLVSEVATASDEQAKGIDQVNTAVTQMDQVTQTAAANSEEAASASEELSAQSEELRNMVGMLIRIVGGESANMNGNGRRAISAPKARARIEQSRPTQVESQVERRQLQSNGSKAKATASARGGKVVTPEDVIPLSDDDLSDF